MKLTLPALSNLQNHFYGFLIIFLLASFVFQPLYAQIPAERDSSTTDSLFTTYPPQNLNNTPWKNAGIVKNDPKYSQPYQTIEQLFAGRVAGVQVMETSGMPGGEFSVRLRGTSSLMNSAEPLYVIDGFPLEFFNDDWNFRYDPTQQNRRFSVNPLSMINPADIESIEILKNASALTSYGARGINGVVLITTKKGSKKGIKIDYESSLSIQKMTRKVDYLNAGDYVTRLRQLGSDYPNTQFAANEFPDEPSSYENVDWLEEVSRTGQVQRHQLQISGGTNHLRYAIQGGLFDHKGIVKTTDFGRKSVRVTLDSDFFNNKLRLGTSGYYGDVSSNLTSVKGIQNGVPIGPIYNADGSLRKYKIGDSYLRHPLEMFEFRRTNSDLQRMISNSYLEADILQGLSFRTQFGVSANLDQYDFARTPQKIQTSSFLDVKDYYFSGAVGYKKTWGKYHFNISTGYNNHKASRKTASVTGEYGASRHWRNKLRNGVYPEQESPFQLPVGLHSFSTFRTGSNIRSFYVNPEININNKVSVLVGYRKDVFEGGFYSKKLRANSLTSRMEWRVKSAEKNDENLVSLLHLHWDFGYYRKENGVDNFGYYEKKPGKFDYKYIASAGGEINLFAGELLIGLDVFYQELRNSRLIKIGSQSSGSSYMRDIFIDKTATSGLDFFAVYKLFQSERFVWEVSANGSFLKNRVNDPQSMFSIYDFASSDKMLNRPLGSFFLFKSDGVWNNEQEINDANLPSNDTRRPFVGSARYVDQDGDGRTLLSDQIYRGTANPVFIWGLSSSATIKNLDFFILIRGEQGQKINNQTFNGASNVFTNLPYSIYGKQWSPSNTTGNLPYFSDGSYGSYSDSDLFLQQGSFVRLQNLAIGYTIPLFKKASTRLYLSGQNLLLLTKYEGWDPEVNANGQHAFMRGTDSGVYPRARTFTVGVQVHL